AAAAGRAAVPAGARPAGTVGRRDPFVNAGRGLLFCTTGTDQDMQRRMGLVRSEEHTSELQSQSNLVCRLLLEKKKKEYKILYYKLIIRSTDITYIRYFPK